MIERYTLPEMGEIWSKTRKFESMLKVEVAVAQAQAKASLIPGRAAQEISKKSKVKVERIDELEKATRHDVVAFVKAVAETVGENGKYIHFGLTSSDVLDTGLSLQIRDAWEVLSERIAGLEKELKRLIQKHSDTLCAGRTHGIHAEPTTFGFKLAGFFAELSRNKNRLERSIDQATRVKLSGPVGTYSQISPELEAEVAKALGMKIETLATQVIPRDRHGELFCSLALFGAGLERLSIELRHLQRTEVSEVYEAFGKGQTGSSAMPHKKNPIQSENLTGLSRLLRGYSQMALENISLWHERDISHSSVERVIFPDAFIIADFACFRMTEILKGLVVDEKRMRANMDGSQGKLFSSHVLTLLVEKGMSRDEAYEIVQSHALKLEPGRSLEDSFLGDKRVTKLVKTSELASVFSGQRHLKFTKAVIKRVLN